MIIYIIFFITIILLYFIMNVVKGNNSKAYCSICGILCFLLLALRKPEFCGSDISSVYMPVFKIIRNTNYMQLFKVLGDTEVLFYWLMKFVASFCYNFNVFLAVIAIPFVYAFSKFIYKYSKNQCLGFIIFIIFSYFFLSFITLRHSLASAILLLALMALIENKNKRFFWYVIIATVCVHRSSILFIFIFFINRIEINRKKRYILIFSILVIALFGKGMIDKLLFSIITTGHFSLYSTEHTDTMNLNLFIINLLTYMFCDFIYKEKEYKNTEYELFIKMFALGVGISSLTIYRDIMFRLALYYTVVEIALIPQMINDIKKSKQRYFITYVVSLLLCFYCFFSTISNLNLLNYTFFWE